MAYDPTNIFARILRGEIPCHRVYEDEHTLAFMDIMPQSEGHTLVVPKAQGENVFDLPPEALAATIRTVTDAAPSATFSHRVFDFHHRFPLRLSITPSQVSRGHTHPA